MSENIIKLQKLFSEKKYSAIIDIIENKKIDQNRSAGLLNLLGASRLLRGDYKKNDLVNATKNFKEAYLLDKSTRNGLQGLINFLNTSSDIFDKNVAEAKYDLNYKLIQEAEYFFKDAEKTFGFDEKLILAIIRIYKRENNLKNTIFYLEKLINNNCITPRVLSSYIYRNCFIDKWKQENFLKYSRKFNDILKEFPKQDLQEIKQTRNEKINIAFLSSDIKQNHSITYFLKSILLNYNKNRFQISLISNSKEEDETTNFFKNLVHEYIKIHHLKDLEAINEIRKKNFDIIIDLMGLTSTNRIILFKNRIAPIQALWLGYNNTTGLDQMDYIFADINTIKKNEEYLYSEKIIYLPKIWNCHAGFNIKREKNKPPFLKNNFITFASFNSFNKINEDVINVWSEILNKVKNSKLILKSSIPVQTDIIKNLFKRNNVMDSIIFNEKKSFDEHLKLYKSVDIALDTFPYNGVTTSFEAIWMGVPVLSLKGSNFNSRCGESINKNLNLEKLIADDKNDYISKAVNITNNPELLIKIRNQVYDNAVTSPLFDQNNFSKDFFKSIEHIYNTH